MKKKLIILLLIIALLPTKVFAGGISDYKETDDQAVIYLFRGDGCGYCRAFLTFLGEIAEEYGKYFKLVSFEVWNDSTNNALMEKVASVTKVEAGGVPYIIIGEKVFGGYATDGSMDNEIKAAIMAQYEDPSYDVMEKAKVKVSDYKTMGLVETLEAEDLVPQETSKSSSGTSSTFAIIFWNAFFIIAATVAIILVNNNNTQKVLAAMNKPEVKETKKK